MSCFRIVGRSAWSACWSIAETVLSTTFFVSAIKTAVENADGCFHFVGVGIWVAVLCSGCAVWPGICHCLCASRVHRAVNKIKSTNARGFDRLEDGSPEGDLDLDGLDLYEYHDVVTITLNNSRVFFGWLLLLCFGIGWLFCIVASFMLALPDPRSDPNELAVVIFVLSFSWLGWLTWLMHKYGVVGKIRKFGQAYRTQPFHVDVPALLLVSSAVYALFLCSSPAPSMWKWSLIATHTARVSKVLAFLWGRILKAWRKMQAEGLPLS